MNQWILTGVSGACALGALTVPLPAETLSLEAEDGGLVGTKVSRSAPGWSGTGYVTGFTDAADRVRWSFEAIAGLYDLQIRFRSPYGPKSFGGAINGAGLSGAFPRTAVFATLDAGLVELSGGSNTLEIGGGWSWYEIDRVDLVSQAAPLPPLPVPPTLVDPEATFAARNLMEDLAGQYGRTTWSGQFELAEVEAVRAASGQLPVIVAGDFMDYSPSRIAEGAKPGDYTESFVALEEAGQVISMMWHWNAPTGLLNTPGHEWWRGFYTDATTFDLATVLATPTAPEYALLLRDIDAVATQLRKFAERNIPVLWRPLHEAEGGWFWWGAKGPEAFKELWRLLFIRLTQVHGLHNLIWVFTGENPDWYPGDAYVDIVGVDAYPPAPGASLASRWAPLLARFNGRKLLALTEFGGLPDIERMQRLGVWWAWFAPWHGDLGPSAVPAATVARLYQSPGVITLDELNAVPPRFTDIAQLAPGTVEIRAKGPRGAAWRLLAADRLDAPLPPWNELAKGKFAGGVFQFTDLGNSTRSARFYRIQTDRTTDPFPPLIINIPHHP